MAKFVAITEASLTEVETRFGLQRNNDPDFFAEWQRDLPELNAQEEAALVRMGERLAYHRGDSELLERAVTILAASPLLKIAGFHDPPFKMRAEASVELSLDDGEEVLCGRIDVLILQGLLWVLVVESKKTTISTRSALPQALAYMMANVEPGRPRFGLVTNGDDLVLVKLRAIPEREYGLSRAFSIYTVPSELQQVLRVLKRLGQLAQA